MAHSSLIPVPPFVCTLLSVPPRPFHTDRGCNKVTQPPPFPRPPYLPTPLCAGRLLPHWCDHPLCVPHLLCPPFPPPPFSRKQGCKGASVHPLPVMRSHLPARFLATALGTTPPRSPALPTCLALCAHARAQERQCATPPPFCLQAVLSTQGALYPLPIYAPHPTHLPSAPLRTQQGCSTDSAPPSPPFHLWIIPSAQVALPPPSVYVPYPAYTPSTPLHARQGRSMDSAPPSSFPFTDSPLHPGCATPYPWFTCPTLPTHPLPLCVHDRGAARTVRHPPPFRSWIVPSTWVALPPTPSLRAPPRLHACHPFACMRGTGGTVRIPLFPGGGDCLPFRSRVVPSACPPVCTHGRGTGGTACPPSLLQQSPPLWLRHPRPLALRAPPCPACMPSPFARAHAKGWCAPACSSPTQPALVPAPPC